MSKSNADRQKQYRDRKRNAPTVTRVTASDVTVTVDPLRNAQPVTGMYPNTPADAWDSALDVVADKVVEIATPTHLIEARARRTNPDLINWGPWMSADELQEYKQLNKLPKYHNRSPIPGDWDYVGVAA